MMKWAALRLMICAIVATGGCVRERVINNTWGDFAEHTGAEARTSSSGNARVDRRPDARLNEPNYAILLRTFTGEKRRDEARNWAERLHKRTNMPELWIGDDGENTNVYRGRYFDAEALDAMADLRQTRMIQYEGGRPFNTAQMQRVENVLAGPAESTGASADMDLKRYFGQSLWSLQVAVYNNLLDDNFQKAAERAAAELRKQGDQAFYFHGKSQSIVTVGLFTYDEAWVKGNKSSGNYDSYSDAVKVIQEKYPHNLLNGMRIEKESDPTARAQPSFLVKLK